ncbi:MAG: M28 family metallopeptidase [Gammaproteobacteria bacterium]|nr:M28 family metallopeptidase [Gammaproteobacteria bacterium]MDH3428853.1 M28 family metallopeptidase [Gammaproteobacteria bacterium]MDH3434164.1 M28 family metallopeptidase [Gammaproteobacteria bacterium]
MEPKHICTTFLFLALSACGAGQPPPVTDRDGALDAVTAQKLEAHVAYLADDALEGRMAGEPGYNEAAQYVADRFAGFSLEPAGEDGWFQQVPLITYRLDEESAALIAHRDGEDTELLYKEHFAMSGDKVRETRSVRAEVVYVGFGVHAPDLGYSDYDGVDVEGKIVAVFSNAPASFPHNERAYYASNRTKAEQAIARGAVGIIGLVSKRMEEYFPWERVMLELGTRPGMAWVTLTGEAADYYPELRGSAMINVDIARELFAGTAISFDEARTATEASTPASTPLGFEVTLSSKTTHDMVTSPNVIGIVRGTDPELADEYVVYSAHLDHNGVGAPVDGDAIYNGAYDNAMGASLLIETARVFAASPPRRSVLFIAVTAEERGLLGSDYFAHYPTVPTASMVANVNLDMPLFLYPVADIIAFGAEHSSLEATVEAAIRIEGFELTPDPMPEETIFIRSDQYSFVRKGVPATFLVPGFGSLDPDIDGQAVVEDHRKNHYHRPSDDLTRPVDWDSAVRFARANARIGYAIADDDARPTWNEGDFFGETFAP